MKRNTKILATIGPAIDNKDELIKTKGLADMFRINTAHGDFEQYDETLKRIKQYTNTPVLIDIKGPEIRIRTEDLEVREGEEVEFFFKDKMPYFSYDFLNEVSEKDKIFFDGGLIEANIKEKKKNSLILKFQDSAVIKPNKGVNIPNKSLKIPSLSSKDKEAIKWAEKRQIAYIALSFVRHKEDVINLKKKLKNENIGIISKIENWEGVKNIKDIIQECDGVMIARGDLGIEVPEQKIPIIQKRIIEQANQEAKVTIVATQMLESMTEHKTPTRAEVSDVANAILDGADTVMLSGETAIGKYPLQSLKVMDKVAREIEDKVENRIDINKPGSISEEMSKNAYSLLQRTKADKLVTLTRSGYSANLVSRYRIKKPILAVTDNKSTADKLRIVWGVKPVYFKDLPGFEKVVRTAVVLLKKRLVKKRDHVIFFAGIKTLQERISNSVEIHHIKDLLEYDSKF